MQTITAKIIKISEYLRNDLENILPQALCCIFIVNMRSVAFEESPLYWVMPLGA